MRMTIEDMIDYIEALEATNDQLVIALKKCMELLADVKHPQAKQPGWKSMMEDFEELVRLGERVIKKETLH
jgi:hypothetical protein